MTDKSTTAMTRIPLAGADLYDWMALRRVSAGGVARVGDHWFDSGRRAPGYVADTLTALCGTGLVTVADPDGWGLARAWLTDAGAARHEQLRPPGHPATNPPVAKS